MASCCGCWRAKYQRKVDGAFPRNANDTGDSSRMVMYALRQPRMLRPMGKYLAGRIKREIQRFPSRIAMVHAGMRAMEDLVQGCHANLSTFVESYLNVIERLLESNLPDYQILGAASFVKFSKIEEPTPSFFRHYDFFVDKFSAMCFKNRDNSLRIRGCGINGLRALFVKTMDALWERDHLSKIVPALLSCITDPEAHVPGETREELPEVAIPRGVQEHASECLHDIAARARMPHVRELFRPMFLYFTDLQVWETPNVWDVYRPIIVPTQREIAIGELVAYLDSTKLQPKPRAGIVRVLAASISELDTTFASYISMFQTLLKVLRDSAEATEAVAQEKEFRDFVMANIPTLISHTPPKQKVDLLIFVLGKLSTSPSPAARTELLLCSHTIAHSIQSLALAEKMPTEVLDPILATILPSAAHTPSHTTAAAAAAASPELVPESTPEVRVRAEDLLRELLNVRIERTQPAAESTFSPGLRTDIGFLRQHSPRIHGHIYEALKLPNTQPSYVAALSLLLKLACDFGPDELLDCSRLVLALPTTVELQAFTAVFLRLAGAHYSCELLTQLCDRFVAQRDNVRAAVPSVWTSDPFEAPPSAEGGVLDAGSIAHCLQSVLPADIDVAARLGEEFVPTLSKIRGVRTMPRRIHAPLSTHPEHVESITFESFHKIMGFPANVASTDAPPLSAVPDAVWSLAGSAQTRHNLFASVLSGVAEHRPPVSSTKLSSGALWTMQFPAMPSSRLSYV
eukprot:m.238002 g.238002  ORF g.238002 m.238002 type:complete len:743 (-) comp21515_c0_seq1:34-2262(-)